ncbi:MAG: ATP-binding cassette domain-containing protein, partial [Comamonadaceae bacterium]
MVENLSAFYGQTKVLDDVSMPIHYRRVTGIIGPTGSGKSTFVRCLCRMHETVWRAERARCARRLVRCDVRARLAVGRELSGRLEEGLEGALDRVPGQRQDTLVDHEERGLCTDRGAARIGQVHGDGVLAAGSNGSLRRGEDHAQRVLRGRHRQAGGR